MDKGRKQRMRRVLGELHALYGDADCALLHENPFQLLVATILSAQCTDKTVNQVTPRLFARYPDAESLSRARQGSVEKLIHSTGFFRNKAKNIIAMSKRLTEQHDGTVPCTMEELLGLPGVARKTANVVLGTAFGISVGVVVDTHVARLSRLLGLSDEKDPVKIERDLMALAPDSEWVFLAHAMIWHGRRVCIARRPRCAECTMAGFCPGADSDLGAAR